jgi:hypothetical protein
MRWFGVQETVGISPGGGGRIVFIFIDLLVSAFVSLSFLCFFFLRIGCVASRVCLLSCVADILI